MIHTTRLRRGTHYSGRSFLSVSEVVHAVSSTSSCVQAQQSPLTHLPNLHHIVHRVADAAAEERVLPVQLVRAVEGDDELGVVGVLRAVVRHCDEAAVREAEAGVDLVLEGFWGLTRLRGS